MGTLPLVLGTVAAVQALLLSAALALRPKASASDRWLAGGFLILGAAVALITASHVRTQALWVESTEVATTLAAAPLVAIWVTRVLGRTLPAWRLAAAFLPALIWFGFGLAGAPFAADAEAIRWAVMVQFLGTAAAGGLAWSGRSLLLPDSRRAVQRVLGGLAILHVAQALRMAAPARVSPDLVPATGGLVLLAVSFIALRAARSPVSAVEPTRSPQADRLLAAFERLLLDEKAFLEPRLSVAQVAQRIGVSSATLSRAINQSLGKSFTERLAELRVEEARRLLLDPRLGHLSVEALGTRAGFGSRSVFFAEFRQRTGKSPAEFRRGESAWASDAVQTSEIRIPDNSRRRSPLSVLLGDTLAAERSGDRRMSTPWPMRLAALLLLSLPASSCSPSVPPLPFLQVTQEPARDLVPTTTWQRWADPASLGWDMASLSQAQQMWAANSGTSAVVIVHRGAIVDQWGDVTARRDVRSIRKSLLSGLWAGAISSGPLTLDTTLGELGVTARAPLSDTERSATLEQLLGSRSGVYIPAARETASNKRRRPERGSHAPGTFFYYNNWDFNLLGEIYRDRVAADVGGEFARQIATPLGMQDYQPSDFEWRTESVSPHPAYAFSLSARDLARYGLLWLRGGDWGGQRLLDPIWIAHSTKVVTEKTPQGSAYGWLWWVQPPGRSSVVPEGYYYADGAGFMWIVPAHDLVIVHLNKTSAIAVRSKLGWLPEEETVWNLFGKIVQAAP